MNRRSAAFLALLALCAFPAFPYEGIMAGQKDVKVVSTKYFDIIYSPQSEGSAAVLAAHADAVYEELHARYKLEHDFRMPVTLTTAQDEFNAAFSVFPYNRIIMYDTQPSAGMEVFADDILMTFRHELTHAVTLNIKSRFWRVVSGIFGDVVTPGALVRTSGQVEGVAVLEESRFGEGRLNSGFATHFVRQAKIEGKFPSFAEITGARDVYIADYNYKFGSAFFRYVHDAYGEDKFVELWHRMENLRGLSYFSVFKKVYGIPMKDAWSGFMESVAVPDGIILPAEAEGVRPLIAGRKTGLYSCLAASKERIVFFDKGERAVYSCGRDGASATGFSEPERLLRRSSVRDLSVSQDGRYITVVRMDSGGTHPRHRTEIYDAETETVFSVPQERLGRGIVVDVPGGGGTFFAAVHNVGQNSSVKIFRLEKDARGRIDGLSLLEELELPFGCPVTALASDSDGKLYYLVKEGLRFVIRSHGIADGRSGRIEIPGGRGIVRGLSAASSQDGTRLYFSYAQDGAMPRAGFAFIPAGGEAEDARLVFCRNDFSGGMFCPVEVGGGKIAYIAEFIDGNNILSAETERLDFSPAVQAEAGPASAPGSEVPAVLPFDASVLAGARDFSMLPYLARGFWVSLSVTGTRTLSETGSLETAPAVLGATFVGGSPWGSPVHVLSAGCNVPGRSGILSLGLSGGTSTGFFSYSLSASVELDSGGFRQTYESVALGLKAFLTDKLYLRLSEDAEFLAARDDTDFLFARSNAALSLGNVHYVGRGYFEKLGFSVSAVLDTVWFSRLDDFPSAQDVYNNVSVRAAFCLPRLLPFESGAHGSYNLPLEVSAAVFPAQDCFIEGKASIVLSSTEIQHAADWFPVLYFNRLNTRLSYSLGFSGGRNESWAIGNAAEHFTLLAEGGMAYTDKLALGVEFVFTPNVGTFTVFHPALALDLTYSFFPEEDAAPFGFALGFALNL